MALWLYGNGLGRHYGTMALWLYGSMELWHYGSMALWLYGTMALWHYGSMALWHYGSMARLTKISPPPIPNIFICASISSCHHVMCRYVCQVVQVNQVDYGHYGHYGQISQISKISQVSQARNSAPYRALFSSFCGGCFVVPSFARPSAIAPVAPTMPLLPLPCPCCPPGHTYPPSLDPFPPPEA
jgi:hypothetical protein